MAGNLEYEEEDDLFVDDGDINGATPISGPSQTRRLTNYVPRAPLSPAAASPGGPSRLSARSSAASSPGYASGSEIRPDGPGHSRGRATEAAPYPPWAKRPSSVTAAVAQEPDVIVVDWAYRMALRKKRDKSPEPPPETGVRSLKRICTDLCKVHSARMYDIGDTPYHLVKDFVDMMPMEQLAQVEEASPHIRKDTDWLWELFLINDEPAFHAKHVQRKGVKRTSGWRRMYKQALEEVVLRQQSAEEKLARTYQEMEREKEKKKVVMLDKAPTGKGTMRRVAGGGVYAAAKTPTFKASGAFGKIKAESQRYKYHFNRANTATTSRTSTFPAPSSVSTRTPAPSSVSRIASSGPSSLPSPRPPITASGPAPRSASGPRIPAPRRTQAQQAEIRARAALPAHLARATAENLAATKAGRSMGITDAVPSPTYDGKVPVKSTASAPIHQSVPAGHREPPRIAPVARPTHPPALSSSYRPRAPVAPSNSTSSPLAQVPAKRKPDQALDVVDVDALDVMPAVQSSAVAATSGMPRRPDPVLDRDQLSDVLFRKKPRPGTGISR